MLALGFALLLAGTDLVDDTAYREVLAAHVKDSKVDYVALQKDRAKLDAYLKAVSAVSKDDFEKASKEARASYLVNAYNAYTLESILDNYPIKKSGGFFNTAPANSIKQIKGVWDTNKHKTAIGDVTLDQIEHEHLRKKYDLPLVHMALVCASKGCPPLRAEPFTADKLVTQMEDQAKIYLASPYGLVVDGKDTIKVSMIFKWFAKDFTKQFGDSLGFVEKYAPADKVDAVKAARKAGNIGYIEYDWSLNDQKSAS